MITIVVLIAVVAAAMALVGSSVRIVAQYYRVVDPVRVAVDVPHYGSAILQVAHASLRCFLERSTPAEPAESRSGGPATVPEPAPATTLPQTNGAGPAVSSSPAPPIVPAATHAVARP